jgi:MFS family permease
MPTPKECRHNAEICITLATETTIVATAMPTIVADLGGARFFSAYLLTQAVTTPIYGHLADIYGRKRVFVAGSSLFLVGSAACGFTWSMASLVVFRTIQGLGAGCIQSVATTIVGDVYAGSDRARVQGWLSGVWALAAIIGPMLGAFIVEHLHSGLICQSEPSRLGSFAFSSKRNSIGGNIKSIISGRCC